MAFSVQMPALGESVTEGTVTRWLKQEGDPVEVDEPLLEVSTDKVDTEIPSPVAGVLDQDRRAGGRHRRSRWRARRSSATAGRDGPRQRPPRQRKPRQPRSSPPEPNPTGPEPSRRPQQKPRRHQRSGGSAEGTDVTMPALGESVTEGTVTRWLKSSATPSRSTSRCSRCPPTRSTPRSRRRWPAPCWRSRAAKTTPSRSAASSP